MSFRMFTCANAAFPGTPRLHSPPKRPVRLALLASLCVVGLLAAGCQSRGGLGDVTGSIGRSASPAPQSQADWQAESQRWAKRYEANPKDRDWRVLSAQGTVADQLGEHERAQQIYHAALKIAPGEPTVMSNLGLSLALSKQLPEAERVLREAANSNRSDIRVRQNLVLVLGLQGRFGEAETLARQDQSPAEAAQTIAYLKRSVSQPNSWDMLKAGGKARTAAPRKPQAEEAPRG